MSSCDKHCDFEAFDLAFSQTVSFDAIRLPFPRGAWISVLNSLVVAFMAKLVILTNGMLGDLPASGPWPRAPLLLRSCRHSHAPLPHPPHTPTHTPMSPHQHCSQSLA